MGFLTSGLLRRKSRFAWEGIPDSRERDLSRIANCHRNVRKYFKPIISSTNRWYLKKAVVAADIVDKSTLPTIYSAMHRLSEMARYEPIRLSQHDLAVELRAETFNHIPIPPRHLLVRIRQFQLPSL